MAIKIIGSTIIDDSRNIVNAGIATVTSVSIGNTQVVSSARQLQNIASLDETTTATIEAAIANAPNTFADLNVTGISTLGVTSATNLTAQQLNVSGVTTVGFITASNLYVAGVGTFLSSGLKIRNAANTFQYNINGGAITADRTLNLPVITTTDTVATLGLTQSFTGTVTFSGALSVTSANITHSGTTQNFTATSYTTGTVSIGGASQTGGITLGQATVSQILNLATGASGVGTTKTINFGTGGLSGSFTQINIGPTAGVGTVLVNTGTRLGIGSAVPRAALDVVGDGRVSGVVTATTFVGALTGTASSATQLVTPRTFQITGDIVASPVFFDGTGNVSLAATIQPNSVALGSDTTGDYVANITGTSNQITVTSGTGEGSTPTLSIPSQFTAPQDVTVTRDLQVNRNLNVTGNVTIGGTTAFINVPTLTVFDPDIVLGYRTDGNGNDISNDTTSNHGGVALASTEGTPLVNLFIAGIETNPATYKKIMWFKSGTFSGLGTDAWLINYAVGIGSTQFPNGTRLAAGSVQFTQNDLAVVRNINASGVVTATSFSGNASSATYATTSGVSTSVIGGIASVTQLGVSGISTLGTVRISSGIVTATSGVVTYYGDGSKLTNIQASSIVGVATYADNSGISTNLKGGLAGNIPYQSAPDTTVFLTNGNSGQILQSNGVGNAPTWVSAAPAGAITGLTVRDEGNVVGGANSISQLNFVGNIVSVASTAGIATITFADYVSNAGVSTSVIGGISSVTQLSVSGVSTFSNGPVFIGAATSTGTAAQRLQVTGGAYVSDNVGIGTTNPGSKLTVNGSVQIQQDSGSNNRLVFRGQPASSYRWNVDNFGSANDFRIFREDDSTAANGSVAVSISTIGTLTATKFSGDGSLLTNLPGGSGSSQWITTSVGIHTLSNVGIGTTNPTSRLTVSGNASITGILTADQVYTSNNGTGQNVRIGDDLWIGDINAANTTRFSGAQNSDTAFIIFGSSNTVALGRTGSGPLYYGGDFTISGVATANSFRARGGAPGALGVNNNGYGFFAPGDNDSGMYSSADGQIEFYTNNTEAVRIDSNQRVGIGTTNPAAKLDVRGAINVGGAVSITAIRDSGNNDVIYFNPLNESKVSIGINTTLNWASISNLPDVAFVGDRTISGTPKIAVADPTTTDPLYQLYATYTNGSINGYVRQSLTGSYAIALTGNNVFSIGDRSSLSGSRVSNFASGQEAFIVTLGGSTSLFHNKSKKFETSGVGVTVTGITQTDNLNVGTGGTVITTTSSGLVGIGTTNPLQKIHVQGTAYVSGNLGIGTASPAFTADIAGDARVTSTNKMRFGGTAGTTNFYIQYNSTANSLDFVAG